LTPLLFVHGGGAHARATFAQGARADWSQALPVVLEKYGLLSLDVVAVDELLRRPRTPSAGCVLVADIPDATWSPLADWLLACDAPVLFGAPLPVAIRALLGIHEATPTPPDGTVLAVDEDLRARAAGYGHAPGGRVGPGGVRHVPRDAALDWQSLPVPLTPPQVEAWRNTQLRAERWAVGSATSVLAQWVPVEAGLPRSPAIVRHRRWRACSFELFSLLARAHSSEPWASGEFRTSPRVTGLETLLLGLIDAMHAEQAQPRARVLPWPRGASWALTVRHDYDRRLSPADVRAVLDAHADVGTRATWYWRARHVRPSAPRLSRWRGGAQNQALRLVAEEPNHEVAHHTERLWAGAEQEQTDLEKVAGTPLLGTSAHGDPTCFRFQGAPNVLWAEERGLRYTELIQQAHFHPHRFVALRADGTVQASRVVCLPHHESFDLSMVDGDTGEAKILSMTERYRNVGGLMQVMNHPDINRDALFALLGSLPKVGRFNCTAAEAVDWWQRTHVADELSLGMDGDRVAVGSRSGVDDVVIEVLLPSGERRLHLASVAPQGSVRVESGRHRLAG
jgi:hypothetical protein